MVGELTRRRLFLPVWSWEADLGVTVALKLMGSEGNF